MGTRSILGIEAKKGQVDYQYMQFDGYPSVIGKEYYETIWDSISQCPGKFGKENGPNAKFFKRIDHFLNNYQYLTAHSIDSRYTSSLKDWMDRKVQCGQEWQYLFNHKGDFIFFPLWNSFYVCTIPWEITWQLSQEIRTQRFEKVLDAFWEKCSDWKPTKKVPEIKMDLSIRMAFPEQGKDGYRDGYCVYVNGKEVRKTMFYGDKQRTIQTQFENEVLTVKRTPQKELPLLIGALSCPEAVSLLERRMKKC